jgi:pimeloyl-ACP methyl ester carboxylesterase
MPNRPTWCKDPVINQSLLNPEYIYGMMAPQSPIRNQRLIWHMYSAQAYGLFHGDLDFYFNGWDGRDRVASIDTKECPVFCLTGEYDWSCPPEMTQKTVAKIKGAQFKPMKNLGHFPQVGQYRAVFFLLLLFLWETYTSPSLQRTLRFSSATCSRLSTGSRSRSSKKK